MKPKALLMTSDKENCLKVYEQTVIDALAHEVEWMEPIFDINELDSRAEDLACTEYIFSTWGMFELSDADIKKYLKKLKAVFYSAGTVKYFAEPFIANDIAVFSAWAANAVPVAEFTVAQIILAGKGYFQRLHRAMPDSVTWENRTVCTDVTGNYGNRIGLIGIGMIGSLVAEMLKNYKLEVWGYDPFMSEEKAAALGIKKTEDLSELFRECNIISNHLANNDQTAGILNKNCFDVMKKDAVFINTGRGRQVVRDDLVEALKKEPLRVALLDVTYPDEPPLDGDELYRMPNVFLSPHIAGSIGNEVHRMSWYMYEEFMNFINSKPVKYRVTAQMLKTMA